MTYKLKDTDKIEVEAGDLRKWVEEANKLLVRGGAFMARGIEMCYSAAFEEEKEEWEDVTDKIQFKIQETDNLTLCTSAISPDIKIENNRIWRRK